jgi:hypothetical protein
MAPVPVEFSSDIAEASMDWPSSNSVSTSDQDEYDKSIAKGGVTVPFPWKLHNMLDAMDREGDHSIVQWQPHGRAFVVHDPKLFVSVIMPKYFNQTKVRILFAFLGLCFQLMSFQVQHLNIFRILGTPIVCLVPAPAKPLWLQSTQPWTR